MKTPPLPHLLLHDVGRKPPFSSDEKTLYLSGFVGKHAAKVLLMLCYEAEIGGKVMTAGAEIPLS